MILATAKIKYGKRAVEEKKTSQETLIYILTAEPFR